MTESVAVTVVTVSEQNLKRRFGLHEITARADSHRSALHSRRSRAIRPRHPPSPLAAALFLTVLLVLLYPIYLFV